MLAYEIDDLGDLTFAADETGQRERQRMGGRHGM